MSICEALLIKYIYETYFYWFDNIEMCLYYWKVLVNETI